MSFRASPFYLGFLCDLSISPRLLSRKIPRTIDWNEYKFRTLFMCIFSLLRMPIFYQLAPTGFLFQSCQAYLLLTFPGVTQQCKQQLQMNGSQRKRTGAVRGCSWNRGPLQGPRRIQGPKKSPRIQAFLIRNHFIRGLHVEC